MYELKKLASGVSLWVFIILCIAVNMAAMMIYPDAYAVHQTLFNKIPIAGVMGRLLLQGIIVAIFLSISSLGHEHANNTEHIIYAAKTGRKIIWIKIAASIIAGIGIYLVLTSVTLVYFFTLHDYSNWSFLWSWIGMSVAMLVCFSLMAAIVGVIFRNSYIAFTIIILLNSVTIAYVMTFPDNPYIRFVLLHAPAWLWWYSGYWFTNNGYTNLPDNFELWGAGASLIILTALCVFVVKMHEKRDIS
ncbi:MAG: hypothetical protein FWE42_04655 [Defluviitaleaceae bacterium]|nr:hypothetical protein [Defluviitaleaceae bacterium]